MGAIWAPFAIATKVNGVIGLANEILRGSLISRRGGGPPAERCEPLRCDAPGPNHAAHGGGALRPL